MQPAFTTEQLRVYRLTQIDDEFPFAEGTEIDAYIGIMTYCPSVAVHASISKRDNMWFIETFGVTGGYEEGGFINEPEVSMELALEFCRALEEHVTDAPLVFHPWDEWGATVLREWRAGSYQLYWEQQHVAPLMLHELMATMREDSPPSDATEEREQA